LEADQMKPVDLLLERLGKYERRNGYYMTSCPAHEDPKPSLSVSEGDDGRALLNCFAGCETSDIVAELSLGMRDLFPPSTKGHRTGHRKAGGRPTATWGIRDVKGELQAVHVRFDQDSGKDCFWRLPGTSEWGLKGRKLSTLPLYGSEGVRGWTEDTPVVLVEGEKARDALASIYSQTLGTVTGAESTPGPEALEVLRDRRVVLWPDNDGPGRGHMERIGAALQGIAAEVCIFEWPDAPEKGDAADHPVVLFGHEKERETLLSDLMSAPRWVSQVSPSLNKGGTPVTPLRFAEMDPPGPRMYVIENLVPKDHTTSLFGDGGSAKSILALSAATAIAGGAARWLGREVCNCPVLYADFELDADEQRRRAYQVARGVFLDKPPHDLLYVSGLGRPAGEVLKGCLDVCVDEDIGLLIIDSLGIALQGDAESARDVIRFHRQHLDPFREMSVTLLVIDHQGKSQAGERYQNKRTFGSVYKENLARSVIQVEPSDRGKGLLTVKLRQTKHNFGPKAEPFGARLTFTEEKTTVDAHKLDATELAEEGTLNAGDRVMLGLKDAPAYPADVAEACDLPLGTVKNELTRQRKRGLVEYTGKINPHTKAKEVRLTEDGLAVTAVTDPIRSCDAVTPNERERFAL
jgi:hypothetical protein